MRSTSFTATALFLFTVFTAAPAWADGTPECNNGPGGGSTECGSGSLTYLIRTTAVGAQARATLEGATALGDAASAISNLYSLFDTGFTVPAIGQIGSTAIGAITQTYASDSVAIGAFSTIGDIHGPLDQPFLDGDTLIGTDSLIIANHATTVGAHTSVTGDNAVAIGYGATSSFANTVSVGTGNSVGGQGAIAVGTNASASTANSIALGTNASASGANSVAIGAGSQATADNTVSVGAAGSERRITNVGAGINATDAVNVSQLASVSGNVTTIQSNVTTIQSNVTTLQTNVSTLQNGLASTNSALGALDNRVDALEAVSSNIDSRLQDVKDRSDAGTAVAVALSGAMYLPGKTFNLTGNIGAYRGAVAGALQVGAMVSANAAVNAGIAKGFNRNGNTAVRAGFTFGW